MALIAVDQATDDLAIARQESLKVLFVDDDPLLREFAREKLGEHWPSVDVAADGEEALTAIRRRKPDIVLLDLEMPRLDGFGVLKALRADQTTERLPVIVITGRADERSIERAFSLGATSFLVKPINWPLLAHQIRYVNRAAQVEQSLTQHISELEQAQRELETTSTALAIALSDADAASAAKSDFLATMSHELRTPLNAVIGFSEVLDSQRFGPLGSPKYQEYVRDILDSSNHLLSLINDVLEFSRGGSGKLPLGDDEFSPGEVIDEAMRKVIHQATVANLTLTADAAPAGVGLRGDRRRVAQVLINLLANAVMFTPAGGQVTVHVSHDLDGLAISVSDTGIGIAAEDIPRALERFSQVENSLVRKYVGTGLGLPLAKQLMELHGGSLCIDSTPQVGTTVTVRFPAERVVSVAAVA
jgi:signal transduction histidine kinase